jgi:hypothetical protein
MCRIHIEYCARNTEHSNYPDIVQHFLNFLSFISIYSLYINYIGTYFLTSTFMGHKIVVQKRRFYVFLLLSLCGVQKNETDENLKFFNQILYCFAVGINVSEIY